MQPVTLQRVTSQPEIQHPLDSFRVLCVCTGNVFRSRLAEHFLRAELASRLGADAAPFHVSSAGTGVLSGRPVHPAESAALVRCGIPADGRPSHRLTAADVVSADLILCADRSHVTAVLELAPAAHRRTFGLREFARVAGPSIGMADDRDGTGSHVDGASPVARARRAVAVTAAFRGHVPAAVGDEIPDPWGRSDAVLTAAADLVRGAVPAVVDALTAGGTSESPAVSSG